MKKQVLFVQGAGEEGYKEDKNLVASLKEILGTGYRIHYPPMYWDEASADFGWLKRIGDEMAAIDAELILAGHSLGASMLLKYLSENQVEKEIKGVFLMATPFWGADADWAKGLKLKDDFAETLPRNLSVFLYHCRDDEVVPFAHLSIYREKLPHAIVREIESGGHQFGSDLSFLVEDVTSLGL